jgi:calcium-dependent protein kinase
LDFTGSCWKKRELESIDLLKKLMNIDLKLRMSAEEALEHSWIKTKGKFNIDSDEIRKCLICIKNFR